MPATFSPQSYQLARHHGLSEALLADLIATDREVEIQVAHDDSALVAIEIDEREPGDDTIKVSKVFALEDFITTTKLPFAAGVLEDSTSPFVRRSEPYALVELDDAFRTEGVQTRDVDDDAPDFSRRLDSREFAAVLAQIDHPSLSRPSMSLHTGWFTRTDDSLPRIVDDEIAPPSVRSRMPLYVGVIAIGVFALGLGVGIATFAL